MDHHEEIEELIGRLPVLERNQVNIQDSCPICLLPFTDFFDQPSSEPDAGLTKLNGCGHIFCIHDLKQWIQTMHGSCPTCRHVFLDIRPRSESDDESSDGGEYIPDLDDDEEEIPFNVNDEDFDDMFEEVGLGDFAGMEEMDLDRYRSFTSFTADDDMEWGLTDGESESGPSEGDMSWNDVEETAVSGDQVDIVVSDGEGSDSITTDYAEDEGGK